MRIAQRCVRIALVACSLAGSAPGRAADTAASKEQQIKAAFVYNFTKFIEWPDSAFTGRTGAIVIGTFCDAPLNAELERVVDGRKVNGRAIEIRALYSAEAVAAVHLLYVCADETVRFGRIHDAIGNRPVVTVGDSATVGRLGGTIVFVLVGDRIRFDIDAASADRADVKISAQLLKLARSVHR